MFRFNVKFERVGKEGIILDIDNNKALTLNSSGALVVEGLMAGDDLTVVAERLSKTFKIESEVARRDIDSLIESLTEQGLWSA